MQIASSEPRRSADSDADVEAPESAEWSITKFTKITVSWSRIGVRVMYTSNGSVTRITDIK